MFKTHRKIAVSGPGEKIRCRDVLRGMDILLLKWFHTVFKLDNDLEKKREKWLGAYDFYVKYEGKSLVICFYSVAKYLDVCFGEVTISRESNPLFYLALSCVRYPSDVMLVGTDKFADLGPDFDLDRVIEEMDHAFDPFDSRKTLLIQGLSFSLSTCAGKGGALLVAE
jgi:hypothetical protein